jgi:hypothetical protein
MLPWLRVVGTVRPRPAAKLQQNCCASGPCDSWPLNTALNCLLIECALVTSCSFYSNNTRANTHTYPLAKGQGTGSSAAIHVTQIKHIKNIQLENKPKNGCGWGVAAFDPWFTTMNNNACFDNYKNRLFVCFFVGCTKRNTKTGEI